MKHHAVLALAAIAFTFPAVLPAQEQPAAKTLTIRFGVYSYKLPSEVYRTFSPAIDHLAKEMTREMARPVTIDLRIVKEYEECLELFVKGEVDFVRFGPASYVLAKRRAPGIELLAAEQEDGQKICKGVIAVRSDSGITRLQELRGKTFAFGDSQSTIGRYLSQARLVESGITAADLHGPVHYLERHDKVFKAVEKKDFVAGAMHINTFRQLNTEGQLRAIDQFDNIGKPWIARAGLEPATVAALRRVLVGLKDKAVLKSLSVDGLLPATDKDYDFVRDGMKRAEQFVPPQARPDKD